MPARTDFESVDCSIARTMAILGQPWTPLVLRDLFIGVSRFDALHQHLGVSRKVLAQRLSDLVDAGVVTREPYSEAPQRYDYRLTEQGWELCDILLAVSAWGDRWRTGAEGPPATLHHRGCGQATEAKICCSGCGQALHAADVAVTPTR
jgi:DNA-binding HxlR family transcriptional regulator